MLSIHFISMDRDFVTEDWVRYKMWDLENGVGREHTSSFLNSGEKISVKSPDKKETKNEPFKGLARFARFANPRSAVRICIVERG